MSCNCGDPTHGCQVDELVCDRCGRARDTCHHKFSSDYSLITREQYRRFPKVLFTMLMGSIVILYLVLLVYISLKLVNWLFP